MKRRLTVSILLAVAAALLIVGVGTLVLARFGARRASEDELRGQVESTADLVAIGEQRIGQMSAADSQLVRTVLCKANPNTTTPGTTPGTNTSAADIATLQAVICKRGGSSLEEQRAQLCDNLPARVENTLNTDVRTARDAFCRAPTAANLDGFRASYCASIDANPITETGARRRTEQARRFVCNVVRARTDTRDNLQSALSKESIDLVVVSPEGAVVQGELPTGVSMDDLQVDRLRAGDTVSGPVGTGPYAAAAIDPTSPELSVIVIARSADPVRGLIPWFLLASGVTLLIGVVVANSLSRKLTQPLREAQVVTARIADGDLSVRLREHAAATGAPKDELDALAHSINAMAEALERSRGLERQFLLSVSHDLRTPLTSIRGYAEAIADGAAPDPTSAASIILAESRRLERLVKDLLDLAKLDARRFTLHIGPLDLNEIATDSADGFRREIEALGLHIELAEQPGPVPVFADPDRLQQVIANLIENAIKYAREVITVRVVVDGHGPRLEVIDDGPGIAPQDLPHVFERLYVAAATPQRKETGSGLGLAIVRELVEAMGGRVDAAGNESGGTRMVLTLPTSEPALPPTPPPDPR